MEVKDKISEIKDTNRKIAEYDKVFNIMTPEEKQLLLIDLCARLPYGVKVQYLTEGDKTYICNVDQVSIKSQCVGIAETGHTVFTWRTIDRIKPYLRPLSSMTEDEQIVYEQLIKDVHYKPRVSTCDKLISWLKENYFDYNYLIEKGLALEAQQEMYKIK